MPGNACDLCLVTCDFFMVRILYWPSYFILKVLSFFFFPLRVIGKENLPKKGFFLYCSNHQSYLDPILLGLTVPYRISYMAKEELFKNRIFSWVLWNMTSSFPLRREGADIKALKEAIRRLKYDSPVVVFPQGTRIVDPKALTVDRAQEGVGFLAAKAGVPIIPAKIIGSEKCLPPDAHFPRRHPITIRVGKPLHFTGKESYAHIARDVLRAILAL